MNGAVQPASSIRRLISGTAAAASGTLTVTRTSSEPASASSMHCCAVARASAVSVIVIDCTTIGAPPPTWTCPTFTPTVLWSLIKCMEDPMITFAARLKASRSVTNEDEAPQLKDSHLVRKQYKPGRVNARRAVAKRSEPARHQARVWYEGLPRHSPDALRPEQRSER